jgi:hypothetical protein
MKKQVTELPQIVLDDWQEEILKHKGDLLLCTGRQIGKTTIFARKGAEYLVTHPHSNIIIVSLTEDQAQLMIIMILDYLQRNHKQLIAKGRYKPTKSRIILTNKSKVLARPVGNTGDAVRGFTGDVLIVDEASKMPELMWASAKPTLLTTGGEIWMCSTPFGKKGYFYQCWLNKNKRFKVFNKSSWDVIHYREITDYWTEEKRKQAIRFLEEEKADMSTLQFSQEYLGMFMDDLKQLFPDELIRKCQTSQRRENIIKNRKYYIGVDVARMGDDDSTFEIIDKIDDDNLIHVDSQITRKTLLTQTADLIINLDRQYDFKKIYVDDEGIGIAVFDILISTESTRRKTEALRNSRKIIDWKMSRGSKIAGRKRMLKEDLYFNLLKLMEQGSIQLLDDPDVFQSFKSVQFEIIADKTSRNYTHIFGNYTHIVEGLIRASWCSKDKSLNIWLDYV